MPRIRREIPADIPAIRRVTEAAFRSAEHSSGTEQFIVSALRRSGQLVVSLVVEDHGQLLGHVAVSPVAISDGAKDWYGLGPVSVLPDHQDKGLGTLLVASALEELRALGAAGCVVLGEPAYYARFGFEQQPGLVLPGVPPQYFQAIKFGTSEASGHVTYHASFEATA